MTPRYLTSLNLHEFIRAAREIPYQRISCDLFSGVEVWMRRDDLLDPIISGNKAYKLLFNLIAAREQGAHTLITCGGAWSNHIHATAAAGKRFGFHTIGIIRGQRPPALSATLQDAERFGMQLHFVTRETYRQRDKPDFLHQIGIGGPGCLTIPEGGANPAGAKGVQLLGQIIAETALAPPNQIWLACGTGITLAGLAAAGIPGCQLVGVPVLKAAPSIRNQASICRSLLAGEQAAGSEFPTANLHLADGYHCGGYAKYPEYLRQFQHQFEQQTGIPLDAVYTAKLAYALHSEVEAGRVPPGSRILLLHSGGLQGRRSQEY
jgi:1-aminocyclopropane-1-carboxylate deaminase